MFDYGNTQHPNHVSPDALLQIINPNDLTRKEEICGIVDTGSVITVLPKFIVDHLGGVDYGQAKATTANGEKITLRKYRVHIVVMNHNSRDLYGQGFREIDVLAMPKKKYALIGRDIINQFKVFLDAPKGKWGLRCIGYCESQE